MEVVVGLILVIGSFFLGASSVETQAEQSEISLVSETVIETPEETNYLRGDGYLIKDLTVRAVAPEGCDRPVLTTDLSSPSSGGIRNVTEIVATSCGG